MRAAASNDAALMMSQWTEDFVLLPPVGPVMRGRSTIADAFRKAKSPEILEYVLDVQEVEVVRSQGIASEHPVGTAPRCRLARPRGRLARS